MESITLITSLFSLYDRMPQEFPERSSKKIASITFQNHSIIFGARSDGPKISKIFFFKEPYFSSLPG